jgi:hypothetical protein
VKTLKGSSFQIEVEATDKVPIARAPDLSCHGSGCWMDWRGCFARFGLLLGSLGLGFGGLQCGDGGAVEALERSLLGSNL